MVVYKPVVEEVPKTVSTDELKDEITNLKKEIEKINKRLGDGKYDQSQAISFKYDTNEYQSNG
jgi:predicted  nucleic acid-binding Zn-ribbon protein